MTQNLDRMCLYPGLGSATHKHRFIGHMLEPEVRAALTVRAMLGYVAAKLPNLLAQMNQERGAGLDDGERRPCKILCCM